MVHRMLAPSAKFQPTRFLIKVLLVSQPPAQSSGCLLPCPSYHHAVLHLHISNPNCGSEAAASDLIELTLELRPFLGRW